MSNHCGVYFSLPLSICVIIEATIMSLPLECHCCAHQPGSECQCVSLPGVCSIYQTVQVYIVESTSVCSLCESTKCHYASLPGSECQCVSLPGVCSIYQTVRVCNQTVQV